MKIFRSIILLLIVITIVSCSSLRPEKVELIRELPGPEIDISEVVGQVDRANTQLKQENFEIAQRIYENLLTTYESEYNSFETAIQTNLAIIALQSGDREKFLSVTEQLKTASAELNTLPRNTQIVLLIGGEMTDSINKRDMRIHSQLYQAVNQAICQN
jgi:hypothetical protein